MRFFSVLAFVCLESTITAQEPLPLVQIPEEPVNDGFNLRLTPQIPSNIQVENEGGITFLNQLGLIRYEGNVKITAKDGLALYSDTAEINTQSKLITFTGNVSILQNGALSKGSFASYNYETERLDASSLRTGFNPILFQAGKLRSKTDKNGKTYYHGKNAGITTHDFKEPNYWLRADEVKVYPEDRITFKNLKVYAGDTPVFWLPYLAQPLDSDLGYHFSPGARSHWGLFLLNSYGTMLNLNKEDSNEEPWLLSKWHFDLRSQRGLGVGLDLFDIRTGKDDVISGFKSYYTYDLDPLRSRTGLSRENISPHRYKIEFKHRHWLKETDDSSLRIDSNLFYLSDQHFLEDFEPSIYRVNPEPDNRISLLRETDKSLSGIQARIPINPFYQTDLRLPEVFWEFPRQPILNNSIFYESFSSIGLFEERIGDIERDNLRSEASSPLITSARSNQIADLLDQTQFGRIHTYHEVSKPYQLFDGLSITPRAGIGHSQYWATGGSHRSSFKRTHYFAGIDTSLKFSKHYENWNNETWGLDEALHVVRPYANLSIVGTDDFDSSFDGVDTLTPTTRPRAIHVGRFSAIDDLQDWSVLRMGIQNTILTKRNGSSHPWLTLDAHIDGFLEDPEFDRSFSNLYSSLTWTPLPWVQFYGEMQIPIFSDNSNFTEFNADLNIMPHEDWEITASYRQISSHPTLEDASDLGLRAYGRLSETWGLGFYQQWSIDDGTLERQEYSIHRDLGSWNVSLGAFIRDNRIRSEYGLILNFSLSEIPSVGLPLTLD